ncbi:MAG TPA: class I SAM-dependent rRNA methyltransferase [Sandaracinaceae bacterium LLY-WYZ-13_1]|nr:class I SAM-dependent rRNA methyltransferase [Sandaracinaceae bacterium LLY-WYZ-13_1]
MSEGVTATLRKNLGRVLRAGHPWVYRDALERFDAAPGTVVTVRDAKKRFLGRGVAERGPIAVRLWTTVDEPVDAGFVRRRVRDAVALRRRLTPPDTDAVRLLHGEGDRLGGAQCDRYGAVGVLRLDGAGTARWRDALVEALVAEARLEGLLLKTGRRGDTRVEVVHGRVEDEPIEVHERGMRLLVDVHRGQKTGLFLDHRDSRRTVRRVAEGMRVLNLYGYTGGFSVAAGLGGARAVETVDVAAGALSFARRSWTRNGLAPGLHETACEDVPTFLERARRGDRTWDLIVSDPPSFAPKKDAKKKAMRSYRALHRTCLKRLSDGGLYLAASCSSHVDRDAFEQTVKDGAEKASVVLQVLGRWGAAADHPRLLGFPEGDYLKVVLCRATR